MLVVKNLPASVGDIRDKHWIPGSGRSPGGGHGNSLQYSCLKNSMDRGTWQATVHGVAESDTTEWLTHTFTHTRTHTQTHTCLVNWRTEFWICICLTPKPRCFSPQYGTSKILLIWHYFICDSNTDYKLINRFIRYLIKDILKSAVLKLFGLRTLLYS